MTINLSDDEAQEKEEDLQRAMLELRHYIHHVADEKSSEIEPITEPDDTLENYPPHKSNDSDNSRFRENYAFDNEFSPVNGEDNLENELMNQENENIQENDEYVSQNYENNPVTDENVSQNYENIPVTDENLDDNFRVNNEMFRENDGNSGNGNFRFNKGNLHRNFQDDDENIRDDYRNLPRIRNKGNFREYNRNFRDNEGNFRDRIYRNDEYGF